MDRPDLLTQVRETSQWDVIIIGGGATGLGTAVDAASRGYRTLLLEGHDFAKGTSSRSTKLVHGGVRYLAQGNISLVREALHERGLLHRNAPHLTRAIPFVIPAYRWYDRPYYGLGLKVYDLLAGRLGIGSTKIISREGALSLVPTLEPTNLRGGIVYYDGQFDDARLAITLLRTIFGLGGIALNYMPVTGFLKQSGRISGVMARDVETDEEFTVTGRVVINATGVFVDDLRRLDDPQSAPMLAVSQGSHLVLDRSFLPGDSAMLIPRTEDGRVLFVIPWHNRALVGTTDIPLRSVSLEPHPMEDEIEFLLSHTARYLSKDPHPGDILSMFAGLRPLVRGGDDQSTAALSRDHTIVVASSGLVTITGGKWTTYRRMAEDTINRAAEVAGLPIRPSPTKTLKLHGWEPEPAPEPLGVYGSDMPLLRKLMEEQPGLDRPLHPRLPYLAGEIVWAARHELARTVEDVLSRRTRALLLDARASQEAAPLAAELLGRELGRDHVWQQEQVEQFSLLARRYVLDSSGRGSV
ncbi:MAG: glycerol-3-phosphate dehydrogenase [Herpetosiphonaceae bacterium]|nr:MAG: glycerol-3-phosphate dehydrogenase [Herpetosiphonaceae bacterium]